MRKKVKKRILSMLLSIVMAVTMIVPAFAEDPCTYNAETKTLTISGTGTLSSTNVTTFLTSYPDAENIIISGYETIGDSAFYRNTAIKSVKLQDGVKEIGKHAFNQCTALSDITFSNSITKIGVQAFFGCEGLTSITLPEGIDQINDYSFEKCTALTSVTIPNGVKWIYSGAFKECSQLVNVEIPDSVTYIGSDAFRDCSSLESITIPNSVKEISYYAFKGCSKLTSITIPESVTSIYDEAFSGCSKLSSITIKKMLRTIGSNVLKGVSETGEVIMPAGLNSLAKNYFKQMLENQGLTFGEGKWTLTEPITPVKGVNVDGAKTITEGDSVTLTATISPNYATVNTVSWSSSDTSVATVTKLEKDTECKVTAVKAGTATIKVSVIDGTGVESISGVNVTVVTPTPTPTPSETPTPTPTPTKEPTVTPTPTPTKESIETPTPTPTKEPSGTPTPTPTKEPSETPTPIPTTKPDSKPVTEKFSDVSLGKWYAREDGPKPIQYVVDNKIMEGTNGGTTFEPDKECTRAMIVKVLYNLENSSTVSGTNPFSDAVSGKWYYDAVTWASLNKVADGYGDGRFGINDNVTREQMAKFLLNYAGFKGYNVTDKADLSSYPDAGSVSSWAQDSMKWANANGIINGKTVDGKLVLDPKGTASRAEAAQMIMNFLKKYGK